MLGEIAIGPFALEHPEGLIATLVGFALLIFLFYRMALPPIRTMLADRSTRIAEVYRQADQHLGEAKQIRDDYADRIARIEEEHRARLEAAVRDSDAARADIIADAHETARALRRRSEEEIERERTRQRILMRRQIVQITMDAAEQSIRDLNSEAAQHRLIADFVTRVGHSDKTVHGAQVYPSNGSGAAVAAPAHAEGETPALPSQPTTREGA